MSAQVPSTGPEPSSRVEILEVRAARDLKRFLRLPFRLYEGDPNWVAPLLSEDRELLDRTRHPFHAHAEVAYFLAIQGGEPAGRIAAIVNHAHNAFHNDRVGFFGFFESVNLEEVSSALFAAAESWLRERGMEAVRGPCNFSTNETCGLLVEGFRYPPCILMTYNPPYYIGLLEAAGFGKAMDLLAYFLPSKDVIRDRFVEVLARQRVSTPIQIRNIRLERFEEELAIVREIYNASWAKNWGFVPMTDAEITHMARKLRPLVIPHFCYFAELEGRPVGFALGLPDVNQILRRIRGRLLPFGWLKLLLGAKKVPVLRIVALGVMPGHRTRSVGSLLYLRFIEEGIARGCEGAELSWILETNHLMNKPIQTMGGKAYKTYRVYEKML